MDVTFLGTGSALPTGNRYQTGIVVANETNRILIDAGSGVLQRLQQYGPGHEAISTVLLTHHHLDHVSDLMPLAKARWLAGEPTLTIVGGPGTNDLVNDLFEVHSYMQGRLDVTVREIGPGVHEIGDFTIRAREPRHSMPGLAYRFGDQFGFSADSEAIPELLEFFDGTAIVAHDCSFPDGVDVSNHPTPTTLGKTLQAVTPAIGRLYLTHLYPAAEREQASLVDSITEYTDIDTRIASDGLTVSITPQ